MVKMMKVARITHIASVASPPGDPPNGLAAGAGAKFVEFIIVLSFTNSKMIKFSKLQCMNFVLLWLKMRVQYLDKWRDSSFYTYRRQVKEQLSHSLCLFVA